MNRLQIEEKYSAQWPLITVVSFILAAAIFSSLLIIENTLLAGYVRLGAFAFFALAVIGLFKLRDGKVSLVLSVDEDQYLTVSYKIKNQLKHSENWDLKHIESVKVVEMPNRSFYNDIVTSDRCVVFRNQDESDWTYLHKMNGRVIPLRQDSANSIRDYVEKNISGL